MTEFSPISWKGRYGPGDSFLGDTFVPGAVEMTAVGVRGGPTVWARFEVRDGVPETVDFRITASEKGRAVRTVDLRGWTSLEGLAENAFLHHAKKMRYAEDGTPLGATRPQDEREFWSVRADIEDAQASRTGPSDDELEEVARVYSDAMDANPTEAVQKNLGYGSRRTAARRVEQARQRGLLPPTTPGKKLGRRKPQRTE
ncbi:MAG: hypothetical protein ACR2JU_00085 [Nocardioidaceae bacterium]